MGPWHSQPMIHKHFSYKVGLLDGYQIGHVIGYTSLDVSLSENLRAVSVTESHMQYYRYITFF